MSGMNEHLLNFKGLMIDEVQRVIIRENQEIELTYTEFEILKLLGKLQCCHEPYPQHTGKDRR